MTNNHQRQQQVDDAVRAFQRTVDDGRARLAVVCEQFANAFAEEARRLADALNAAIAKANASRHAAAIPEPVPNVDGVPYQVERERGSWWVAWVDAGDATAHGLDATRFAGVEFDGRSKREAVAEVRAAIADAIRERDRRFARAFDQLPTEEGPTS